MLFKSLHQLTKLNYKLVYSFKPTGTLCYENHSHPKKPDNFRNYLYHGYTYSEKRKLEIKELLKKRVYPVMSSLAKSDITTIFGLLDSAHHKATGEFETSPILQEAYKITKQKRRQWFMVRKFGKKK